LASHYQSKVSFIFFYGALAQGGTGFWIFRIANLEAPSKFFEYFTPVDCLVSGFWYFDSHWERFDSRNGRINPVIRRSYFGFKPLRDPFFLFQAQGVPRPGSIGNYWVTSEDLDLQGTLAQEWQSFRKTIINNGIKLRPGPNVLKWTGDSSGRITVKNVYEAVECKKHAFLIGGWRNTLWKWDCPLKLKLFSWLVVENKVLSWDNLQRRASLGRVFALCVCRIQNRCSIYLSTVLFRRRSRSE